MSPPAPPDSCLNLLRAMIRIDSVTPRTSGRTHAEQALGDYLRQVAESWGLATKLLPVDGAAPNLLVTSRGKPDAPWWMFDSHLDTVGVGGMTIDPFAAEVRDQRVYGRGACDTKGSGAAMLWAMKNVCGEQRAEANIALLFTVGEEARQTGARAFVERQLGELPWRPAGIVVGEPTGMNVVRAANGYVRFKLKTHGQAAHSTAPEQGRNAISDMARAIAVLEDDYIANLKAKNELTGRSTCSINLIQGGSEHNVVPDHCEITVDHRLAPGQSGQAALTEIRRVLDQRFSDDASFRYDIADLETAEPFCPELNQALSEAVVSKLRSAGLPVSIQGAPYTTNANHYARAGLPSVVVGPGDIAQAHTKDEWILVEQLESGVLGYQALMSGGL